MRKFTYILAAAACLSIAPAMAQSLSIGVGEGVHERGEVRGGGVVVRERDNGVRGRVEIGEGRRDFARDRIVVRGGSSCRMVTVRTRTPRGNIIIRKIRRCG